MTTAAGADEERFLTHLGRASDLVGIRRLEEAEVEVLRALSILPHERRALNLLALVRFKLGRIDEALETYGEIAVVAPNDPGVRLNLGLLSLKLERIDDAIRELEVAGRLLPDDLRVWSYLGFAYSRRNQTALAAAAFRRAGQAELADEIERTASRISTEASAEVDVDTGPMAVGAAAAAFASAEPHDASGPGGEAPQPGGRLSRTEMASAAPSSEASLVEASAGAGFDGASASLGAQPVAAADSDETVDFASGAVAAPGVEEFAGDEAPGVAPEVEDFGVDSEQGEPWAQPLSDFAVTRLADGPSRPPAGARTGSSTMLRWPVTDEAHVRIEAAAAMTGELSLTRAHRRVRGRLSAEPLGTTAAESMVRLRGHGEAWLSAPRPIFPLLLDDDILFVRQERVVAFDAAVSWEWGRLPKDGLGLLQFRGRGRVAIDGDAPAAIRVLAGRPTSVPRRRLLGWVGRVLARGSEALGEAAMVRCEGEGVLLIDLDVAGGP